MNTLTSAPCTSRTSPKNKEPRLARDRRGKLGWRGIDEAGTHTCDHRASGKGREKSVGREGWCGSIGYRSTRISPTLIDRQRRRSSSETRNFRSGDEKTKKKKKETKYSKLKTEKNARFFHNREERNRLEEELIFVLYLMRAGMASEFPGK